MRRPRFRTIIIFWIAFAIGWGVHSLPNILSCCGQMFDFADAIGIRIFGKYTNNTDHRLPGESADYPNENRVTEGFGVVYPSIHAFLTAKASSLDAQPNRKDSHSTVGAENREQLIDALGVPGECQESSVRLVLREQIAERHGIRIDRIVLEVCGGPLRLYGLIGQSLDGQEKPLVIALHGSAASPERIFGLDDPSRYQIGEYHHEFAFRLAKAGFAVFAPQLTTEIKLRAVQHFNQYRNAVDLRAMPLGYRIQGIEIGMISNAIDYFAKRPGIAGDSVAAYGISLGGQTAFYLAAIDDRLDAVVVSQWIDDRAKKLLGKNHPIANWRFVSELSNTFFDILPENLDSRVSRLIAPRPMFIEIGGDDQRAKGAEAVLRKLEAAHKNNKSESYGLCYQIYGQGKHEIMFDGAVEFLEHWLLRNKPDNLDPYCMY